MVDVFEYDAQLRFKCHDGNVNVTKKKIVTLGTGGFSARSAMCVGGTVDSAILACGINGYTGKVINKISGDAGLDQYIVEFDLTDTTPDLLKKGYDKARALSKLEPTSWQVM